MTCHEYEFEKELSDYKNFPIINWEEKNFAKN